MTGKLSELAQIFQEGIVETSFLDVIFKEGWISKLGTAVVHDLIQDFINERKLLLDIIFGDISIEVGFTDEDEMIEELNGHGAIDIGFGGGEKDEILVGDTHVRNTIHEKDGILTVLFGGDNLRAVVGYFSTCNIILEAPIDEDLALDIDEYYLAEHGLNYKF